MRETLGNRMSKKLKEYGISQRLLATLTNTTEVSVSRYVNDKRIPKADVLYRIAGALHTTTDDLLGLKAEQTNEEWFIRLSTEDKAYFLNNVADACYYCGMKDIDNNKNCPFGKCRNNPQEIAEWLKQPHKEETE